LTARGAFTLARRNLAHNRRGAALSALGVAVGIGCLTFFSGLGAGVSSVMRTRVFPVEDATLEVVPPHVSLGSLFANIRLDDTALARLRGIPGVTEALPKLAVKVSAVSHYDGEFFGQPLHMGLELIAMGVDPKIVSKDLKTPESFADAPVGQPVPVVISTRLLEIYNKAFAEQRGLPRLTAGLLTGFRFPVEWGRSFVAQSGGRTRDDQLEVVGFSDHALLGGVTVPLATARRLNHEYGQTDPDYSSIVLRAAGPDQLPAISAEVRRRGFAIDDTEQRLGEQVGFGIVVVTAALALLSGLITLLAAINITHAFYAAVRERRKEIGILRAVGASQGDILRILLLEAAAIGFIGALAGVAGGVAAAAVSDLGARRFLPDFPYKPDSFFQFTPVLIGAALAVGLCAALFGAYWPARSAARSDPAAALCD
jgi:ABC-type lipoprotein release transport system permease subunit